jgi:hypothetical protein
LFVSDVRRGRRLSHCWMSSTVTTPTTVAPSTTASGPHDRALAIAREHDRVSAWRGSRSRGCRSSPCTRRTPSFLRPQTGTKPGLTAGGCGITSSGRQTAPEVTQIGGWLHLKWMGRVRGPWRRSWVLAYASGSTCSGSLNEFPIGSGPYAKSQDRLAAFPGSARRD